MKRKLDIGLYRYRAAHSGAAIMNQSPIKQNTISAEIVLDCFDHQSDRGYTARMVQPKT